MFLTALTHLKSTPKSDGAMASRSILNGAGASAGSNKKNQAATLTLTSLVDCFSVLVIYLLVATTVGGVELATPKSMQLPKASYSEALSESTILRIEANKYFLNNKLTPIDELPFVLKKIKTSDRPGNNQLVIQADRRIQYSQLNPVVLSGLNAGYEKIQFAVLQTAEGQN